MLAPNGSGIDFQSLTVGNKKMGMSIVFDIEEGSNGEIWLATDNNGIIRITGKGTSMEDYHLESFTLGDGQINSIKAFCLYIDAHKHTWAGTDGGGLYLFDNKKSAFRSVHNCWNLLSDVVNSILGDSGDNLWLGTNAGLIKLNVRDLSKPVWKLYTVSDGLQDNFFNRNASFTAPTGEMFFGGLHGYNYFYPNQLTETNLLPSPAVITDIKIFNQPFENLKAREKTKISSVAPQFAKKIVLDYRHNNLNIEFTSLDYIDLSKNKYAYRLDGFDPDYVYTSQHFAYYNNLTPGKYTFLLKAANSNGIWQERSPLEVVVLPPPWKTIWAYLIYTILIAGMLIFAIYIARTRLIMRNNLSLKELEKKQMEELNHVKLQFFTNITHELLTPLTIISTALNELKTSLVNNDIYQIMESNTNRLMRLLQQIMEFRKAETGNLKLRVMKGDLAAFVRKTMESIRPLMKKKMLHISLVSNPDPFPAWFDPDKIDKIIG
jgi:ligand-binding sensor domain-containing protein